MSSCPYLDTSGPIAFAHRGASLSHPENTMAAFAAAVDLGYRYLETDVHLTRDNRLIAFHDNRLDRVTDKKGLVSDLDWAEIRAAKVGGTGTIPLFEDILDAWPETRVNVEPKSDAAVEPLLDLLRDRNFHHRVCVGSFSGKRIEQARKEAGDLLCTSTTPMEIFRLRLSSSLRLPLEPFLSGLTARCVQIPVRHYGIRLIDRVFIDYAHKLGLKVHVWTINEEPEMHRLLDLGVDGIMSDNAELLKSVFQSRNLW